MTPLTGRQNQVLEFIQRSSEDRGVPPTVREIGKHLGISSPNAVFGHLKALREKGHLGPSDARHRGLQLTHRKASVSVPLLGRVRAGAPVLAEENIESYVSVDRDLARRGELFALKVAGDSMTGAGILEGDTVVVRRQETARAGDIVVALKDDEATVKYYRPRRGRIFLEAANPAYAPMPGEGFSILGALVGLIRSYAH